MAQAYTISGIKDSGVQLRLEVRDLQKNKPIQFSLYIQALNIILDKKKYTDPISWYQIGGIHGLPYSQWTGDPNGPSEKDPNSQYGGYCYHASALFPTWHRVLLLLTEQAIVSTAVEIATELEKKNPSAVREKWVIAAKELRQPFWDWTRDETAVEGIPKIFQATQIQITLPGGATDSVNNPLNHYKFAQNPGVAKGLEYMHEWKRTYRWANKDVNPTEELYDQAQKAFSVGTTIEFGGETEELKPLHWLKGKVAALFQYPLKLNSPAYGPNLWGHFSNTSGSSVYLPNDAPRVLSSIEEPHNMVHLDVGGNGSMASNDYAAFDPIFFLHHTNVDRLYAFWEYLYPNYWIADGWTDQNGKTVSFENGSTGNFEQDPNAPIDDKTSLIPFRNDSLNYWISNDVRSLLKTSSTQKYYSYPAIKDPRTGVEVNVDVPYDTTNTALRAEYQQVLYNEWNPDLHNTLQTIRRLSSTLHSTQRDLLVQHHEAEATSHLRHFVVEAHLPEFAFSGSYRLELYVRPPGAPQSTTYVVNNTSVLTRSDAEQCDACKDRNSRRTKVRGYMPLDPRIVLHLLGQLDAPSRTVVTNVDKLSILVKESLGTRLLRPDGKPLAIADPLHQHGTVLEEEKAPELTLHSHLIAFDHKAHNGAAPSIKFHSHEVHGSIGSKASWKVL